MVKRHLLMKAVARSTITGLLLLSSTTVAHSAGFYLIEQSVSSMGTAYANGASGIDDASTIWFNPATMTRLAGQQASGGAQALAGLEPLCMDDDRRLAAVRGRRHDGAQRVIGAGEFRRRSRLRLALGRPQRRDRTARQHAGTGVSCSGSSAA